MAKVILLLLRLGLGGTFLYAGFVKIAAAPEFAADIQHYEILPWPDTAILLAIYLPWLELVSGVAVILRRFYLGGLASLGGLALIFIAALASAWLRGLDIYCGCFGRDYDSMRTDYLPLLARDLVLLAIAGVLLTTEIRAARRNEA